MSARFDWDTGNAAKRNKMLEDAGIKQRTLTLRKFDDLELVTKADVIYAHGLVKKGIIPPGRSSTNSQGSGGFDASADSSMPSNPASLAVSSAAFFYSQASGR